MDKQGTYGIWSGWASRQAWAVDFEACCCAFMFKFEILLLICAGQRPGPSGFSRKHPLWNPKCSSRRKTPSVAKAFSSAICFSFPLCHRAPNSWLRLVGNSHFESNVGWISFCLALWLLLEVKKLLWGPVKIGKAKAISSVDSHSSGPGGKVSLGPWSGD